MVNESMLMQEEIRQKQREAEERVRRMREENRRLAQKMGEADVVPCAPPTLHESGRFLPLLLALVVLKEGGPIPLVLALMYLSL
ncbi:MAG: hypothetical protein E7552_05555 [Ruminococcaceae bacterium]|nr:hypothetical protein [Oscillospiraceae bacterium]